MILVAKVVYKKMHRGQSKNFSSHNFPLTVADHSELIMSENRPDTELVEVLSTVKIAIKVCSF